MIACNHEFYGLIKYLIEKGSNINAKENSGFTALTYAVKQDRIAIAIYLISKGADIHTQDINGCTLQHWAAYKNNVFLLKMFRNIGLNLQMLDKVGFTPLDRAIANKSFDAVRYL